MKLARFYAYACVPQLNDVLSLCVGLWAVKVANEKTSSPVYTYGVRIQFSVGGAKYIN